MSLIRSMTKWITQAFVVSLFISFAPLNSASANPKSAASEAVAVETVVEDFYKWYMVLYPKNIDPLRRHSPDLPKYISTALIRELEKKVNSRDGLDFDYFLQSQDYLEDWPTEIHVAAPRINDRTATTVVTLGAKAESRFPLAVSLVKEKAGWKIRKVNMLSSTR